MHPNVLEPYTATKLKARSKNVLKDFLAMAGPLGVTHILVLNKTKRGTNLRIARTPRGPTLTFRVPAYTLSNLTELHLYRNSLSGTLPSEWGQLTSLNMLWLGGNKLSGSLPDLHWPSCTLLAL